VIGWAAYRRARAGMRRTFQIPRPFSRLTVSENVMLGAITTAGDIAARKEAALAAVGLSRVADKPADTLGPSQIRLLEVARALVARPALLLLDEPLAGLDAAETAEIIEILRRQRIEGVTIVLVDHAISVVADFVDRMIVLDNGALIADGPAREVTGMPQVVNAYLGSKWDHARY
jgi:branched-chain amino acid transport system permease protein